MNFMGFSIIPIRASGKLIYVDHEWRDGQIISFIWIPLGDYARATVKKPGEKLEI